MLAVCAAPLVASYVAFYWWQPSSRVNYGELLEPRVMPDAPLERLEGGRFRFSEAKGEWLLLLAASSQCDERCQRNLTYMRQVRLAQGREAGRIERVWMVTDDAMPRPELLADHPGLHAVRGTRESLEMLASPAGSAADHIFLVDPLGHLMMRFPRDADPRLILKDLARLLRQSRWK
jgi:cytochrome oxidase Cu insertion factor (SCO1/SenC/PrrC family)